MATCAECSLPFDPSRASQRFCTPRCRYRAKGRHRYHSDPEHRRHKNARRVENAQRRRHLTERT